jgi:hypothetical protein
VRINGEWKRYSSRKKSYGWIIYEKGRTINKIYPSSFGMKINLKTVVKQLLGDVGYCLPKKSIAV